MWLWENDLRTLGFRRKSERYWRCDRRFELPDDAHLSVFSSCEQPIPVEGQGRRATQTRPGTARSLVELTEFHVTFLIRLERIHFYYHERRANEWVPRGHTSRRKIARLGSDPVVLCARADAVAIAFAAALGGVCLAR